MKVGKKYAESVKSYEHSKAYDTAEAVNITLNTAKAKFDETIELHVRLGVDPARQTSRCAAFSSFPTAPARPRGCSL